MRYGQVVKKVETFTGRALTNSEHLLLAFVCFDDNPAHAELLKAYVDETISERKKTRVARLERELRELKEENA